MFFDDELLREGAAHQADALVRVLRGKKDVDFVGPLPDVDRLQEQLSDLDDDDAQHQMGLQLLLQHAHAQSAPQRLRAALAAESVEVVLADGSALTLDDAESTLARKEARAPYPPLSHRVGSAVLPFLDDGKAFDDALGALGYGLRHPALLPGHSDDKARQALQSFVDDTADAHHAALDVLQQTSNVDVDHADALARVLDLPDEHGAFADDRVQALTAAVLDVAQARLLRPVKRLRAPRALAGLCLSSTTTIRTAWAPSLRSGRFRSLVSGSAAAVGVSLIGVAEPAADDAGRLLGVGLQHALHTSLVHRAVFDDAVDACRRREQHLTAQQLLLGRICATAALALLDDGVEVDAVRDRLGGLFGFDLGEAVARSCLAPSWPGELRGRTSLARLGAVALGAGMGAAVHHGMRDRFDELWPLLEVTYDFTEDIRGPLSTGSTSLPSLLELQGTPGQHLSRALLECL